jgi:Trk K+ transport system NAD-binding subunit
MVLGESSIAVTESSMEVVSPIKLNLSQNPEQTSTKTIANRISSRQRRTVMRNEDFLW